MRIFLPKEMYCIKFQPDYHRKYRQKLLFTEYGMVSLLLTTTKHAKLYKIKTAQIILTHALVEIIIN